MRFCREEIKHFGIGMQTLLMQQRFGDRIDRQLGKEAKEITLDDSSNHGVVKGYFSEFLGSIIG